VESGLRREAELAARRLLDELMVCAGPALERRTDELLQEALVCAPERETPLLLVLPASRLARMEEAKQETETEKEREKQKKGGSRAPGVEESEGAGRTVELHGVPIRLVGVATALPRDGRLVAILGWLGPGDAMPTTPSGREVGAGADSNVESAPVGAPDGSGAVSAEGHAEARDRVAPDASSVADQQGASRPLRLRVLAMAARNEPPRNSAKEPSGKSSGESPRRPTGGSRDTSSGGGK